MRLEIDTDQIPEHWHREDLLGCHPPLNLLAALAQGKDCYADFLNYVVKSRENLKLPPREREMIILRIAHLSESHYIWGHHVPLARDAGIAEEEIPMICDNLEAHQFSERDRAILQAVDEMMEIRQISDDTFLELQKHLTRQAIFDIVTIATQCYFFATFAGAFNIPLEENLPHYPNTEAIEKAS